MSLPIFFGTKLKLCDICGTRHESYQAHVFGGRNVIKPIHSAGKESGAGGASNAASNKVTASNNASNRFEDATNRFSDFIRNASPEEREKVYAGVLERATNRQSATNNKRLTDATNRGRDGGDGLRGDVGEQRPASADSRVLGAAEGKTKNRRSRESYNAYQREYMRRRRGVASG